ncbi:hypothetical protein B0H13DRAFT_2401773 [Mycena leptocephala]|nr:hypothetical protein B0H13DRAFT_2401773 [Mycena leptocephala]
MDSHSSAIPQVGRLTIPTFVGTLINWGLLGALFVQVYIYCVAFPKDKWVYKLTVGFIVVAEIMQTLGATHDAFVVFGKGWGNPEMLDLIGWAWFSCPIVGATIASVSQLFFAWRISILGNNLYIPALIAAVTVVQFGGAIWTSVLMFRVKTFSELQIHLLKPPATWLAATAAADVIIVAATMFYVIRKRQANFSRTTLAALSRVVKVTVETGVLSAIFASVNLYLFLAYDGKNTHLVVCSWFSKIYSNSVLVILNSRAYIGHASQNGVSPATSDVVFSSYNSPSTALQVSIETETTQMNSMGALGVTEKLDYGMEV